MQILLLFCLIKNFLFKDYSMERYGSAEVILNDNGYNFCEYKGIFNRRFNLYLLLNHFKKNILIILNMPFRIMSQVMI